MAKTEPTPIYDVIISEEEISRLVRAEDWKAIHRLSDAKGFCDTIEEIRKSREDRKDDVLLNTEGTDWKAACGVIHDDTVKQLKKLFLT